MIANPLPDSIDALSRIALKLISGLTVHGRTIGVKVHTAAAIRSDLDPALLRHRELEALKLEPNRVLKPVWRQADAGAADFIRRSKRVLRPHLGDRWNPLWAEAGFTKETLAMPDSFGGRQKLLQALGDYFANHPEWECSGMDVTAARSTHLQEALVAARRALECHVARCRVAKIARDRACSRLRKRLRRALSELDYRLPKNSPLRVQFGLTETRRVPAELHAVAL